MRKQTLKNRVANRIKRSGSPVFMRRDFSDLGGYDQVGRALRQLTGDNILLHLGYGVYVRAEKSTISDRYVPAVTIQEAAKIFLEKVGLKPALSSAEQDYMEGSTQIPVGRVFGVKGGRISRQFAYNGKVFRFENIA